MKITDEAKVLLENALKQENFNCVIAGLEYGCCSGEAQIVFGLGNIEDGDTVYDINGIKCVMEEETYLHAEGVTIYVENDELMFMDENASMHHHHDHDHECGCGGHHHEEHDCDCEHDHEDHECQCGHHHE
ncbi:Fe-S cluster assembly iron-binding protein IscA [Acholeplasma morum]|jgi:Fe-S cluster assembly iron-binding protein IscA|uniref:hypothetical protein n=1 Tax=Paracholeplasma morum TaxID=264637 RepID=UPI0019574A49|nr:hypothetical protein [Paracholeplasma morum]MBM7452716.1 Fe-S cluster assembly iron-binding protein IscA [Paracholeplasma morum]